MVTVGRPRSLRNIRELPSGSLRVRVYAGVDPLTGKRHELTEVIPAGKDARKLAEKARTRMLAELDQRRSPRTKATVSQLMERYLEHLQIEGTTRAGYEGLVRRHIEPLLCHIQLQRMTARRWTGSTASCGAAGTTVVARGQWTTARRGSTTATTVAGRTGAG